MNQRPDTFECRSFRVHRAAEAVFVAVVMGFLLSFPVRIFLRGNVTQTVTLDGENRKATAFPDLQTLPAKQMGSGIETWYNDAMPSRAWLIKRARKGHLNNLRSPFGVYVPGRHGQWFRTGAEWPELEDYLGTFRLSGEALDRWVDLFAGRQAWAEAMGCTFVTVISPPKVQMMPDAPFSWLSRHRGESLFTQLESRLSELGETGNILSARNALRNPNGGEPLFLTNYDIHPDAEGLYRMYEAIAAKIPECGVEPWFDNDPPSEVASGRAPGCWTDGHRLRVSAPGSRPFKSPLLSIAPTATTAPNQRSVSVLRGDGPGLHIVLAHTSYLRNTLSSWENWREPVVFPFDARTHRVDSLLWKFLGDGDLDFITSESVPDAIVQEINEWHLSGIPVGHSAAKRNAASFFRAVPLPKDGKVRPESEVCVRVILSDVEAGGLKGVPPGGKCPCATATLLLGGERVASMPVNPGFRRPVFFPPVSYGNGDFAVEVSDGRATSGPLVIRVTQAGEM